MTEEEQDETIYGSEGREGAIEDEEISPQEEAFMRGYEEAEEESEHKKKASDEEEEEDENEE